MSEGYNVLSLFDGCSGAFMALMEADVKINNYYSSEIDKFASKAASLINPDTINLGDVRKIEINDFKVPDIICGGFPCKNLSFAGGKDGLIYDSLEEYLKLRDEYLKTGNEDLYLINGKFQQSIMFWEYLRILKEVQKVNPDVLFFAENVRMDKKYELMVNTELGLKCQHLNSNLVSAQNRHRLYWSNISTSKQGLFGDIETYIEPPKDRGIFLKDIIEEEVDEKYYLSDTLTKKLLTPCVIKLLKIHGYVKVDKKIKVKADQNKASCFTAGANSGGNHSDMDLILYSNYRLRRLTPLEVMRLQTVPEKFQKILLESRISDSQLYKMMGNGWTILMITEYFKYL